MLYRSLVQSYLLTVPSAPLLSNILPHLQTLVNFITNTLPKPVLVALLYRLSVLQVASRILPTIGADNWESDQGEIDGRPVRAHAMWFPPADSYLC
jgi:hypothetical protein